MWRECRGTKIEKGIEEALEEGGEGIEILKEIEKIRANKMGMKNGKREKRNIYMYRDISII